MLKVIQVSPTNQTHCYSTRITCCQQVAAEEEADLAVVAAAEVDLVAVVAAEGVDSLPEVVDFLPEVDVAASHEGVVVVTLPGVEADTEYRTHRFTKSYFVYSNCP